VRRAVEQALLPRFRETAPAASPSC
jgi:hypothetical protein